jgi:hypothetical protein
MKEKIGPSKVDGSGEKLINSPMSTTSISSSEPADLTTEPHGSLIRE